MFQVRRHNYLVNFTCRVLSAGSWKSLKSHLICLFSKAGKVLEQPWKYFWIYCRVGGPSDLKVFKGDRHQLMFDHDKLSIIWEGAASLIICSTFLFSGCDRLHFLLQDPHECSGPDGTAGQPVARRQQHHGLPPPPHPLGPLLPAGPAGAASPPAPPAQPPQRAAPAGPQVVQPETLTPPSNTFLKTLALYRTLYS